MLTGESLPARKHIFAVENPEASIGDMRCLAFRNTRVVVGRGKAVVVATGMNTEVGKIAQTISLAEGPSGTPLQRQMNYLMLGLMVRTEKCLIFVALIAPFIGGVNCPRRHCVRRQLFHHVNQYTCLCIGACRRDHSRSAADSAHCHICRGSASNGETERCGSPLERPRAPGMRYGYLL